MQKDHPKTKIIGDESAGVNTRRRLFNEPLEEIWGLKWAL